jgi:dienelactone hydrolase
MKLLWIGAALAAWLAPAQKPDTFTVKTEDEFTIHGELQVPKKKDAKSPLVVFIHDAKGKRSQYSEAAGKFFRAGYAVVTFDLRGHNESDKKDGRAIDLEKDETWKFMRRDLSAAIKHCQEQAGVDGDRVVYVGSGFGAAMALKAGASDESTKAVIGLSTPLAQPFTKDDCSKPIKTLAAKVPILLVTGKGEDDKKNAKYLETYAKEASPKAFEIKNVPNDVHGADLLAAKPSLAEEMIAWLKKNGVDPAAKPK